MLQIFRLSLEAVFPILILIALGYLLRRIDIIAEIWFSRSIVWYSVFFCPAICSVPCSIPIFPEE